MQTQKIKVDELKLSDIITEFSRGKIRIPRFQRDYVWDKPRVVKLLNSIYREYPIGTFFFWEASPEYIHLYRNIPELNIPEPDERSPFNFILDGQQRITSLYVAMKGLVLNITDKKLNTKKIDYSEISFDLDKEEFTIKRPDNDRFISLSSMIENQDLNLFRSLTDERARAYDRCYQQFRAYPLSVVYVRDQGLGEACEIFERINQGGVKLSLFDLVVASTWSNDFDLKEEVNNLNEQLDKSGFGTIPPETILQSLSLYIKGQATRVAQLQLKKDEIVPAWPIIAESIRLSVDYLKMNLGVKIIDFIPYPAMIAMLAYLYAKKGNKALSLDEQGIVEKWFWKSSFSQHYSMSTPTTMSEDRRDLFDVLLRRETPEINYPINLTAEDIKDTRLYRYSSTRNGIFCLMAQNDPLHFANNTTINLDRSALSDINSPERHHLFPRAYLKRMIKTYNENSIANFAFIPQELNRRILDKKPAEYFPDLLDGNPDAEAILKSHFIDKTTFSFLLSDNFEEFILNRSKNILSEIEKRIGKISLLEARIKENPNGVIDVIEERLRIIIHQNLEDKFGEDYWKEVIPGNIQDNVNKKIRENSERYPDRSAITAFDKLSFFSFAEYKDLILRYWQLFEDEFFSRGDFERYFLFLNDYRNSVKHNRELSSIEKKQGEAAAEWFSNLLDPYFSAKTYKQVDISWELENKKAYLLRTSDGLANATGKHLDSGEFIVLGGSIAKTAEAPSFEKNQPSFFVLRKQLIDEKILVGKDNGGLELKKDYLFNSASAAAAIILGRAANGWTEWKDENGKTLDENERQI